MQVVKQNYTSSEAHGIEGIIRKFTDIYMAVFKVESNYTKEEILEFYINHQWFAGDGNLNYVGISGVEQACQYYFGKSVKDITLAEASIIAGMFQNPRLYNPYKNPQGVKNRQTNVLKYMVMHGYLTDEEKDAILEIPIQSLLVDRSGEKKETSANQAAIDYVLREIENDLGMDAKYSSLKIYTTFDKDAQDVLTKLENGEIYTFTKDELQEGIAITSIDDGSIVALSGGRNYAAKGTIRAVDIRRQPGSTAKIIFDYGPYIEYLDGSTASTFLDEEYTYSNGTPINDADRKYQGLLSMRTALMRSRNIPALKAFQAVYKENPDYIANFAKSLGINYGGDLYESASIGGFDGVSPLQMSAAYAAFGRGGYYIKPYSYTKVEEINTGKTYENKYEKNKVMSEETAYMITNILVEAATRGVGGVTVKNTEIAAKSGTTNHDANTIKTLGLPSGATRDAWNITYSPEYAIALWVGFDNNSKDNYLTTNSGNTIRNAIMKAVGSRVYSKGKTFTVPSGVSFVEIESGTIPIQLASEFTPDDLKVKELFKEGLEPTEVSTRFAKLNAPTNGKASYEGGLLKLSWDAIKTPDAIDDDYLQEFFNTYYEQFATKYYEERLKYNTENIGTLGYQIYRVNDNGEETYIGRTEKNYFIVNDTSTGTFIVRSCYSKFTKNISDGLKINATNPLSNLIDNLINNNSNNDTGLD